MGQRSIPHWITALESSLMKLATPQTNQKQAAIEPFKAQRLENLPKCWFPQSHPLVHSQVASISKTRGLGFVSRQSTMVDPFAHKSSSTTQQKIADLAFSFWLDGGRRGGSSEQDLL